MNHPTREELIEFLYEELAPERQAEMARHVEACGECEAQVKSWRLLRQGLAAWEIPPNRRQQPAWSSPFAWHPTPVWRFATLATAAAVLLLAGFGLARLVASPPADTVALREAVARQVRGELRAELEHFNATQDARQQDYQQALARTLGQLEAKRLMDYASLRHDMETLAVRAEDELLTTRQDLVRLAASEMPPGTIEPKTLNPTP